MRSARVLAAVTFAALLMPPTATAFAHGGGTDGCGGHHDHKRGGYHVHDYSAYCGCYPRYAVCVNYLKAKEKEGASPGKTTPADDTGDQTDGGTGDGTKR